MTGLTYVYHAELRGWHIQVAQCECGHWLVYRSSHSAYRARMYAAQGFTRHRRFRCEKALIQTR